MPDHLLRQPHGRRRRGRPVHGSSTRTHRSDHQTRHRYCTAEAAPLPALVHSLTGSSFPQRARARRHFYQGPRESAPRSPSTAHSPSDRRAPPTRYRLDEVEHKETKNCAAGRVILRRWFPPRTQGTSSRISADRQTPNLGPIVGSGRHHRAPGMRKGYRVSCRNVGAFQTKQCVPTAASHGNEPAPPTGNLRFELCTAPTSCSDSRAERCRETRADAYLVLTRASTRKREEA